MIVPVHLDRTHAFETSYRNQSLIVRLSPGVVRGPEWSSRTWKQMGDFVIHLFALPVSLRIAHHLRLSIVAVWSCPWTMRCSKLFLH